MVFAALYLKYNACIDNGSFFVFVCLLLFKFKSRNGNVNGWWCKMCRYSRIKHHVRTINNSRKPTFLHFLAFHKSISCIISIHLLSRYWNLYNFHRRILIPLCIMFWLHKKNRPRFQGVKSLWLENDLFVLRGNNFHPMIQDDVWIYTRLFIQ